MITVTRLDHSELVLNADLILTVEHTPDTVITLTTGDHLMVRETVAQVVERVVEYRRRVFQGMCVHFSGPPPEPPPGK